ncbi:MAG TPA: sialidase family protein [Acidimicrobiales bacterium]|nr:sialidase family protein [Acidimicrobiales bacterium]
MTKLRTRLTAGVTALAAAVAVFATTTASSTAATTGPVVVGQGGSEPGVAVGPGGVIYVNAPDGLLSNVPGSPSYVWRSTDGGSSWTLTPAGLRANLPGGGDSNLAVDGSSGAIYLTDLWLGSATISSSTDQGNTWTPNPVAGVPVEDRQWIATTGSGPLGGIVYEATHQIPSGLIVSKSVDGAKTFPISSVAATPLDQTGCVCPPGNLIARAGSGALGTGDSVGLIYATSSGGVNFARSTNGGLTFSQSTVAPASSDTTSSNFPVVTDAGNGSLYAAWLDVAASSDTVKLARSVDWGATWSAPMTIVNTGTSVYPWVAASGSKVAVSLYHTSASGTPDGAPAGTQWFESYLESSDGGSTWGALTTADTTPAKTGAVCTAGTGCSADRELGDFQSDAVDASGNVDLSYVRVPQPNQTLVMFDQVP